MTAFFPFCTTVMHLSLVFPTPLCVPTLDLGSFLCPGFNLCYFNTCVFRILVPTAVAQKNLPGSGGLTLEVGIPASKEGSPGLGQTPNT